MRSADLNGRKIGQPLDGWNFAVSLAYGEYDCSGSQKFVGFQSKRERSSGHRTKGA